MALIVELVNLVDLVGLVTRTDLAANVGERKKESPEEKGERKAI